MKQKSNRAIPCRVSIERGTLEVLSEIEIRHRPGIFRIHDDKIWFQVEANEEDYFAGELWYMDLDGDNLRKADLQFPGQIRFNDGWFYWFDDECTVCNLCRTDLKGNTEVMYEMYYCIMYFPHMWFGTEGMVVREDLTGSKEDCLNFWYIPFDGSGVKLIETVKARF
ncbi:MAG: hypothetical protein ACOX1Q_00225 [Eubacteriales bacterium]